MNETIMFCLRCKRRTSKDEAEARNFNIGRCAYCNGELKMITGKLTRQRLKELAPGIFAQGITIDSPEGVNVANTGKEIKWVAVRGDVDDWAIYTDNPYNPRQTFIGVAELGDKIKSEENIKKLVPCDEEAFKRYRH